MKKIIWIISLLLVVCCVARIIYVNKTNDTYHVETEKYKLGEKCTIDDMEYRILESNILTMDELNEKYGLDVKVEKGENAMKRELFVVVKMEVTNASEIDKNVEFNLFFLSGAWCNGPDMSVEVKLNGGISVVKAGETATIYKATFMNQQQFGFNNWKNKARKMKVNLGYISMPREVIMECY